MLGRSYENQVCSISRTLEVVGERWTLLVLRDLSLGVHRFDALVESIGLARTVLTQRLAHLLEHGVITRHAYQQRPERFEYHLSDKGQELLPLIAHLLWWGDRHYPEPGGPPRLLQHRDCGGPVESHFTCAACRSELSTEDVVTVPGPGHSKPDSSW